MLTELDDLNKHCWWEAGPLWGMPVSWNLLLEGLSGSQPAAECKMLPVFWYRRMGRAEEPFIQEKLLSRSLPLSTAPLPTEWSLKDDLSDSDFIPSLWTRSPSVAHFTFVPFSSAGLQDPAMSAQQQAHYTLFFLPHRAWVYSYFISKSWIYVLFFAYKAMEYKTLDVPEKCKPFTAGLFTSLPN